MQTCKIISSSLSIIQGGQKKEIMPDITDTILKKPKMKGALEGLQSKQII